MSEYSFEFNGFQVVVDRREQSLHAEVDQFAHWTERPPAEEGSEDEGYGPDSIRVLHSGHTWREPVHRSVADAGVTRHFTPAFAIAQKAKRFDDRLVAALDLLLHEGAGRRMGKRQLLARLEGALPAESRPRGLIEASRNLLGGPATSASSQWLLPFLKDPMRSKPMGLWAESQELSQLFKADRMLQQELEPEVAAPLREALEADQELKEAYLAQRQLAETLSGQAVIPGVLEAEGAPKSALFPPSESAAGKILRDLGFDRYSVPEGFDLNREVIARIREGRLDTTPEAGSSFYERQLHALAALLEPEVPGLTVGPRYRELLEETFAALFGLTRESHLKQLETTPAGGRPLIVTPYLTVEPLPEYYHRLAEGYRFLRHLLLESLGQALLTRPPTHQHTMSLYDELWEMELLVRGAWLVSQEELGRPQQDRRGNFDAARAVFRRWQLGSTRDPDLAADLRTAVPLWFDRERRLYRVRAIIGLETQRLTVEFTRPPKVELFDFCDPDRAKPEPLFHRFETLILAPVTVEADLVKLPNREEFRMVCDQCEDLGELKEGLERLSR